jgi:hypothetical protein
MTYKATWKSPSHPTPTTLLPKNSLYHQHPEHTMTFLSTSNFNILHSDNKSSNAWPFRQSISIFMAHSMRAAEANTMEDVWLPKTILTFNFLHLKHFLLLSQKSTNFLFLGCSSWCEIHLVCHELNSIYLDRCEWDLRLWLIWWEGSEAWKFKTRYRVTLDWKTGIQGFQGNQSGILRFRTVNTMRSFRT